MNFVSFKTVYTQHTGIPTNSNRVYISCQNQQSYSDKF